MKIPKNSPEALLVGALMLAVFCSSVLAQQNMTDVVSITTYFPSPNAVFTNLEVKRKLVVGNITESGNSNLDQVSELGDGQIYVGNSILLEPLSGQPAGAGTEGQIIFNNATGVKKLQFYNGTWQSAGG